VVPVARSEGLLGAGSDWFRVPRSDRGSGIDGRSSEHQQAIRRPMTIDHPSSRPPRSPGAGDDPPEAVPPAGEAAEPEDFGAQLRSGMRWSFLSTALGRILNPLLGIVLARILTPEDFGVFAVALVALNALISINDLGVTLAVVRWPGKVEEIARTATSVAITGSLLFYGACFAAAPWVASTLNSPEATGVLRLLALGVVIDGAGSVPLAFITRAFRQDQRMVADWSGFLVSAGVTVGLAVAGFGAWSLAWGRIAGNLVNTALLYRLSPLRPRPGWERHLARELLRFGLPLTGSSFLVFAMLNVDYVIVGHELGTVALGVYLLAFNLSSFPVNVISTSIRRVLVPAFARFQGDHTALREVFLRWLHQLALPTVLLCTLLATLAHPTIRVVYGSKWRDAAPVLVFLAVLGGARVVIEFIYDVFVAVGRSRPLLWLQGLWVVVLVPALTAGARLDGVRGVGLAHALVAVLVVLPVFAWALRPLGMGVGDVAAQFARPLLGAAGAGAVGLLVVHVVGEGFAGLVAGAAAIVVVYAALGATPAELRSLPRLVRRRGVEVAPAE